MMEVVGVERAARALPAVLPDADLALVVLGELVVAFEAPVVEAPAFVEVVAQASDRLPDKAP